MQPKRKFTIEEAHKIGGQLGIHQGDFNFEEFRRGLEVELEHGLRDPETNVTNDDTCCSPARLPGPISKSSRTITRAWINWKPRRMSSGPRSAMETRHDYQA